MLCTVQTHSERPSLPQRTCSLNRDDGGKIRGGLEASCLAQGCTVHWGRQGQKPDILTSSPAICSFSRTTTFCCSNAYGVLMALKIIIYDLVFLTSGSFTYRHTACWTQLPPGTVPHVPALRQLGVTIRWPWQQKSDTSEGKEEGPGLVKSGCWNTFTSCNTVKKFFVLRI